MQSLRGQGAPLTGDRQSGMPPPEQLHPPSAQQPLSPEQRTTLERLIVRIMSLSTIKEAELWAGLHHQVGVTSETGLFACHFPAAEQYLHLRLSQVQKTHALRQLQQQLTDLLPVGNNRQAVSDFIRQQFGHTVLSSLNAEQLQQVLTMLQKGEMAIPQPQQNTVTDRSLLPAEHQALNQQIARLVVITGESPAKWWDDLLNIAQLHHGAPIPVRFFPLFNQYLQASLTLTQQGNSTLAQFVATLKQPPDSTELHQMEEYCQAHYNTQPNAVLSTTQVRDLLHILFRHRAAHLLYAGDDRAQTHLPLLLRPVSHHPLLSILMLVLLVLLLWALL